MFAQLAPGVRIPRSPWRGPGARIGAAGVAAPRGAHNHALLRELLGADPVEIAQLERDGVRSADDAVS